MLVWLNHEEGVCVKFVTTLMSALIVATSFALFSRPVNSAEQIQRCLAMAPKRPEHALSGKLVFPNWNGD